MPPLHSSNGGGQQGSSTRRNGQAAGAGKGRPSRRYPSAAVDQAAAIRSLLDRRVPLDEMAMAMFLDKVPVTETVKPCKAFLPTRNQKASTRRRVNTSLISA
jgi:hypothetical protein